MARIRTLKPDFFRSENIADLPYVARLLFQGLWCIADRDGRLEDRPRRIKLDVLPWDNEDVDALLQTLHDRGFIQRYEVDGVKCIWVVKFTQHQRITGKEAETPSALPEPPPRNNEETSEKHSGSDRAFTNVQEKEREGNGYKEGSVRETGSPSGEREKSLKSFVKPTEIEMVKYFESHGSSGSEARKCWHFYESKGWKVGKAPMKIWKSAASGWIERNKSELIHTNGAMDFVPTPLEEAR